MSSTQQQNVVEVAVDQDRMKAWLHPVPDTDMSKINREQIQSALKTDGIELTDRVVARIGEYLEQLACNKGFPDKFLIAEGQPPKDAQDGTFVWAPELAEQPVVEIEETQIDYHAINSFRIIEKDSVIGKMTPPRKGVDGVDVHGHALKPKRRPLTISLGTNVRQQADGAVVAETYGRVDFKHGQLSLEEIIEIAGDVDFECGNLDAPCDIHIRGTVLDEFEVKSKQSVTIDGRVRAASVDAGMDVVVRGGILGGESGSVSAGGSIAARFCEDANLVARGNISLTKDAVNSRLQTDNKILADRATIIGGTVSAKKGVVVGTLGSEAGVPTKVTVGVLTKQSQQSGSGNLIADLQKEKQAEESNSIAKLEKAAKKIRQLLQPSMEHPDRLSEAHRKRASALLTQADNIEEEIKQRRHIQEKLSKEGPLVGTADIIINKDAYPKVVLAVDDRESLLTKLLKGPVRIEKRKIKNVSELVSVNLLTGSITRLQSQRVS